MAETAIWVPIVATVVTFSAVVAIVAISLRYKARRLEHEEIMKAIEHGQELPTLEIKKRYNFLNDLRIGVFLIAIGLGVMMFFGLFEETRWSWDAEPLIGIGAIPLFIGIGYVVMALIMKKVTESGKYNGNGGKSAQQ
ncbi:MAG TPA: DUF6249 domain-containing protein [Acidobacteriota bacterium]|nr:DUF6249 domain-containing protein [Acidobacteriota bacterium]